MATFAELQARVAEDVIDVPPTVSARIPDLINEAIRELQDKHNFYVAKARTAVLTTTVSTRIIGASGTIFPDFHKFRGLPILIDRTGRVNYIGVAEDREAVERLFGTIQEAGPAIVSGEPRVLLKSESTGLDGAFNVEVFPLPDGRSNWTTAPAGEYRIRIPYWRRLPALSGGGDTNWFTVNAVEWLHTAAAAKAFFLDHDEDRGQLWTTLAAVKYKDVLLRDKYEQLASFDTLRPSLNAPGPKIGTGDYGRRYGSMWRG